MKKKKIVLIIGIVAILLIGVIGVTFAFFTYDNVGSNQQLVLGDIYMHYNESSAIDLQGVMPGDDYKSDGYFEFTIEGKNTYTKKDIWYDISVARGEVPAGKTEANRIPDKYLKFKLVEVNDGVETELFTNQTYEDLTNQRVYVAKIEKNTTTEINKTYRLYMTISEKVTIGNVGEFTSEEWEQIFATIKVNVTGDFNKKIVSATNSSEFKDITIEKNNEACKTYVEEDGITYISGTKDCIDFNYVWYSGKLWRITAIYPDGTMKMITDDAITTISYGSDVNFYTNESNKSYMYQWLNEDFLDTLYNYENIIVREAKWNATNSNASYDSSSDEVISTKLPETTMVTASVGLLNSYEYYMSYKNTYYLDGYLNIVYGWWLLNPYSSSDVWAVHFDGYAGSNSPSGENDYYASSAYGARPSIHLKSNIEFLGGSGTKNDPYRIGGDKEKATANTTLLNTRTSGEYVTFDGELYRIVNIEDGKTKINKNDYVKDESNVVLEKKYSNNTTWGNGTSDEYWDYYLNNTWYTGISTPYKNMIVEGTYYLGTTDSSYKGSICKTASNTVTTKDCEKTTSIWNGFVGLPRYGEMFASQQGSEYSMSKYIWLMNRYSSSDVWYVDRDGSANYNNPSFVISARPSIHLTSGVKITGGTGTKEHPFEISL